MTKSIAIAALLVATGIASTADARTVVFVHGRNQGPADTTNYWHNGGYSDNGITAFTGNNSEGNYVYAYDATMAWSDLSTNSTPVCALTNAMYNAPGTDQAVVTHSAGGNVAIYMLAVAQNGWANGCSVKPSSAKVWTTYVVPVAGVWRGSELANAVYGHTGGNFLQQLCGTVAGSLANLLFNQASSMTYALQTSYVQNNYASLVAYGSYGSIYLNWGTTADGDDSTAMKGAAWCAGMPTNDGVVGVYSASYGIPGSHAGWSDSVGHSSNRRNDYKTYAANVWAHNPY